MATAEQRRVLLGILISLCPLLCLLLNTLHTTVQLKVQALQSSEVRISRVIIYSGIQTPRVTGHAQTVCSFSSTKDLGMRLGAANSIHFWCYVIVIILLLCFCSCIRCCVQLLLLKNNTRPPPLFRLGSSWRD